MTWDVIAAELADTLEAARRGRPAKTARKPLARDLVGAPKPKGGVCVYCGAPAPGDVVCAAHSDLPHFDPAVSDEITEPTFGRSR